jgi:hypothetical protein
MTVVQPLLPLIYVLYSPGLAPRGSVSHAPIVLCRRSPHLSKENNVSVCSSLDEKVTLLIRETQPLDERPGGS